MVRNTQTRYSAGIHGAVVIPKRVALSGHGVAQSHIQIMPGNVGYGILNENGNRATAPWTDFVFMKDFSVFGNGYLQGVGVCLSPLQASVRISTGTPRLTLNGKSQASPVGTSCRWLCLHWTRSEYLRASHGGFSWWQVILLLRAR